MTVRFSKFFVTKYKECHQDPRTEKVRRENQYPLDVCQTPSDGCFMGPGTHVSSASVALSLKAIHLPVLKRLLGQLWSRGAASSPRTCTRATDKVPDASGSLTFQFSGFGVQHPLFLLILTRNSFIFISVPKTKTKTKQNEPTAPTMSVALVTAPSRTEPQRPRWALAFHSQGVDRVLDDLNPAVPLLFGAGVHFHHLWVPDPHTD